MSTDKYKRHSRAICYYTLWYRRYYRQHGHLLNSWKVQKVFWDRALVRCVSSAQPIPCHKSHSRLNSFNAIGVTCFTGERVTLESGTREWHWREHCTCWSAPTPLVLKCTNVIFTNRDRDELTDELTASFASALPSTQCPPLALSIGCTAPSGRLCQMHWTSLALVNMQAKVEQGKSGLRVQDWKLWEGTSTHEWLLKVLLAQIFYWTLTRRRLNLQAILTESPEVGKKSS